MTSDSVIRLEENLDAEMDNAEYIFLMYSLPHVSHEEVSRYIEVRSAFEKASGLEAVILAPQLVEAFDEMYKEREPDQNEYRINGTQVSEVVEQLRTILK